MSLGPILITGSTGQVGGALVALLGGDHNVLAPTRAEMDLASPDSIRSYILANKPAWIINPAAYTQVDKAESDQENAELINAVAPGVMGELAKEIGAAVLHFSTDYVFSGEGTLPWKESDATGPHNVYGSTKLAGEQALAASGAAHATFRTSWVYASRGKNFPLTILRVAREREDMNIVADQIGAPTLADDLAHLAIHTMRQAESTGDVQAAMQDQFGGLYHACGGGETSWFGFAGELLRRASEREPEVRFADLHPIPTEAYPTPAKRPLNSRMDCSLLSSRLGFTMPDWKDGVARFMEQ